MIILNKTPAELQQILDFSANKMRIRAVELLRKYESRLPETYDYLLKGFDKAWSEDVRISNHIRRLRKFLK